MCMTSYFMQRRQNAEGRMAFYRNYLGVSSCTYLVCCVCPSNQENLYGGGGREEEPDLFIFTR